MNNFTVVLTIRRLQGLKSYAVVSLIAPLAGRFVRAGPPQPGVWVDMAWQVKHVLVMKLGL